MAEQVRTASCDHGIKRWRLHLTQEQIASVALRVVAAPDDGFGHGG
nr:DUF6417 family protein [Streptomyces sp. S1D4-11]